jgi:hypothetical protein
MPDAAELLHMNLHVFSERDPEKRRAAIERTYVDDVRFIDPDGESVGRDALNDAGERRVDGRRPGAARGSRCSLVQP